MKSTIPGITAKHAIITPTCVANRTARGAWDEAVRRLREEFDNCQRGWAGREPPTYHLVLTVERPADTEGG